MDPDKEYLVALLTLRDCMKQFVSFGQFVNNQLEVRVLETLSHIAKEIGRVQRVMERAEKEAAKAAPSPTVNKAVHKEPAKS